MGLVKSFKKLLKSNDKTEASTSDSAAVTANTSQQASVHASNSTQPSPSAPLSSKVPQPRTDVIEAEQSCRAASSIAPESPWSSGRLFSGLPPNSSLLLGVGGRIASFTSTDRHETTVIERSGSRLILQEVKQLQDSDEQGHAGLPKPLTPSQDLMRYRRVQRVASVPMLLDAAGPLRRPAADIAGLRDAEIDPELAQELNQPLPGSRLQGTATMTKRREPPKRRESLKCLLKLDQYHFNEDVSTLDAVEALGFQPGDENTSVETTVGSAQDILTADGRSSVLLAASPALPQSMRRLKWTIEDYQLIKQLHKGYASDVYQARCKYSDVMVAIKVYKLKEQGDIQRMQLYREIKLHSKLQHNNVIQYLACFLENNRVFLVQDFATGGDLLKFMYKAGGRLTERQSVGLVLQPFLVALHYLHTQGIVHRDIKPENVIFTESKILKLADFGLALDLNEERANTRAGTLDYMAPEVLKCPTKKTPDENKENPQSAHYHLAVDAWAVGVFAYELVVGTPPFKAAQMIDTARNIIHAPVQFPESVSEMARDFILQALQKHAGDRPTVIEMLHHPWITMYQRRSSVRAVYTRSNSLMELVMNQNGNPLTGGADGDAGATSHQSLGREAGGSGQGQAYRSAPVASGVKDDDRQRMQNGLRAGNSKLSRMAN